jgi:flagellar hook-associated protein 2
MAGPIGSFSGIGSGFNYSDLIDEMIKVESAPVTTMQARIKAANAQLSAYTTYRSLLDSLKSVTTQLRDGSAFQATSTTVSGATSASGRTTLSASASAGAQPGTYAIQVLQTAQAEKLSSMVFTSASTALGISGDIVVNGKTVTIAETDTLADIRDKFNTLNTGATPSGVSASIISDSSSAQRLILTSEKTGSAGIDLVDGPEGIAQQLGLYQLVAGRDAEFTVDGVTMTRSTNTVSDVIANMTLTFLNADPSLTATVVVERSPSIAQSTLQNFVDAYNKVIDFIHQQQKAGSDRSTNPPLYNIPALRLARSALPTALLALSNAESFDSAPGTLGIALTKEGRLSFDSAKFQDAFTADAANALAIGEKIGEAIGQLVESWTGLGGTLSLQEKALNEQIEAHEKRIDSFNARLDLRRQTLLKQFLAMDVAVQRLQSQGNAFLSAISSAMKSAS